MAENQKVITPSVPRLADDFRSLEPDEYSVNLIASSEEDKFILLTLLTHTFKPVFSLEPDGVRPAVEISRECRLSAKIPVDMWRKMVQKTDQLLKDGAGG